MAQPLAAKQGCCSILEVVWSALDWAATRIVEAVQEIIQLLGLLFQGRFEAIGWNWHNRDRFKAHSHSQNSHWQKESSFDSLKELATTYQKLEGLNSSESLRKAVNQKLSLGNCHGQCIALLNHARENGLSLEKALASLNDHVVRRYETLEIFRATFQAHKQAELLDQLEPTGFINEVSLESSENLPQQLLDLFTPLSHTWVLIRLYDTTQAHSLLLEIDPTTPAFSFYNSAQAGCYTYPDLNQFIPSLLSHIRTHHDLPSHWDLEFYST